MGALKTTEDPDSSLFEELAGLYTFEGIVTVSEFLEEHAGVAAILPEVSRRIQSVLGKDVVRLSLRYHRDPLGDEALFVMIRTALPLKESFGLLSKFDDWCFANVDRGVRSRLGVMVEETWVATGGGA